MAPRWIMPISVPIIDTIMAKGDSKFKGLSQSKLNESIPAGNVVCLCYLWRETTHEIQMPDTINMNSAIPNHCFSR